MAAFPSQFWSSFCRFRWSITGKDSISFQSKSVVIQLQQFNRTFSVMSLRRQSLTKPNSIKFRWNKNDGKQLTGMTRTQSNSTYIWRPCTRWHTVLILRENSLCFSQKMSGNCHFTATSHSQSHLNCFHLKSIDQTIVECATINSYPPRSMSHQWRFHGSPYFDWILARILSCRSAVCFGIDHRPDFGDFFRSIRLTILNQSAIAMQHIGFENTPKRPSKRCRPICLFSRNECAWIQQRHYVRL